MEGTSSKKYSSIISIVVGLSIVMTGSIVTAQSGQISQIAIAMADRIERVGVQTVAVADFTDLQGNVTELGRYLAEQFSVAIAGSGRSIVVVDRIHLKTLLKEHKLSSTGLIDPSTARQLGKIAGVEALITGSLTPFGDTVEMAIKVLDTETAKIFDARTESLPKTKTIQELLEKGITTTEGITPTGTITTTTGSSPAKSQQPVSMKGFTFSNPTCKRTGASVTCSILLTSPGQNKELRVCAQPDYGCDRTKIIDDLGNEYSAEWVQIGDRKDTLTLKNIFPADVPTKSIWEFKDVSTDAKMVTIMAGEYYDENFFYVQFRNVPLAQ